LLSAHEIADLVGRGELDPVAVVEDALERIAGDADLNAIMVTNGERAIGRARAGVTGRLAGVPLLVKDLIDVAGLRITYGSRIYADHIAAQTAPCVAALEAEGAIVVATTTCDEFAWGVGGQNVHWGDTGNPHRPGRITGGSSSGNAAGLAVGMGALAIGTDTGGSVRLPAAGCGVVGFKTPYGSISTEGVFPLAPALDTVGPMARTVEDCALAWSVLTGEPVPEPRLDGKRIGKLTHHPSLGEFDQADPAPDPRADDLPGEPVELPAPETDVWPVFYAGAAESHRATYPKRAADYGPVITAKLERAIRTRPQVAQLARAAMLGWREAAASDPAVDVIVSPVLGLPQLPAIETPEEEFRIPFSAYARVFNFLGWPAIAIGETQLAARDARTLLEAALAWPPRP
jgi:Asp-tRNA(Asn)/Glu-tRNA(Gln) amidotransferase A subunit family amidase